LFVAGPLRGLPVRAVPRRQRPAVRQRWSAAATVPGEEGSAWGSPTSPRQRRRAGRRRPRRAAIRGARPGRRGGGADRADPRAVDGLGRCSSPVREAAALATVRPGPTLRPRPTLRPGDHRGAPRRRAVASTAAAPPAGRPDHGSVPAAGPPTGLERAPGSWPADTPAAGLAPAPAARPLPAASATLAAAAGHA